MKPGQTTCPEASMVSLPSIALSVLSFSGVSNYKKNLQINLREQAKSCAKCTKTFCRRVEGYGANA